MANFNELLFSEFRTIPVTIVKENFNDNDMVKAITDNENLTSLGFTLKPTDIVKLAKCNMPIYPIILKYMDKIKANPIYPNFPEQIMKIDEATFRFHQMIHYFSTYDMECLFGIEIKHDWLPDVPKTKKTKKQDIVLPAKTISLINESDKYEFVIKKLLTKSLKEKLTLPEKKLIEIAIENVSNDVITKTPDALILFHKNPNKKYP